MIQLTGEIGIEITLYDVIAKVKEQIKQGAEKISIQLTTVGGDSQEGRDIRNYLKELSIPVEVIAVGYVYSAGITIMTGTSERYAQSPDVEFLMHSPKFHPDYFHHLQGLTDDQAQYYAKEIEKEKTVLAEMYSEAFDIDRDSIINLMEKDMIIDTQTAIGVGIIRSVKQIEINENTTKPDYKIAAKWYPNSEYKSKINEIMDDKKFEELKNEQVETRNFLQKIIDGLKSVGKIKNIEVNTEQGVMLELEGDTLEEGVRVINKVEDGTYTVIYNDKKWNVTIADQVITALEEVTEEEENDEVEAYKKRIAELEEQLKSKEGIEAKLDELEKEVAANREFVSNMKKITNKYQNEKGEFEFSDTRETTEPTIEAKLAEYREQKRNK